MSIESCCSSTSSASCIPTAMSIDDIQIISISASTSSNTNSSSSSCSSNANGSSSSSSSKKDSSPSSSSNCSSYSSERICELLQYEKQKYDIIDNRASTAVASYWSCFGFPAKLNMTTGHFERIFGFTSCRKCKKTFVYGPNSGTAHMKQHPCTYNNIKISTQTPIDKMMLVRKTLTNEQSKVIKDLIVRWVSGDIRPFSIIDDGGLRALVQECVRLGMYLCY
jgi:hypothetical protein